MRIAILQHVAFEGPAQIGQWLDRRGLLARVHHLYAGDALPRPEDFDLLVIMGGPMSVHDETEYPWLAAEKRLLREALAAGKRVLGICLGGQLLAEALGGEVRVADTAEIGWHLIEQHAEARRSPLGRMLPQRLMAMHWHGETFSLPAGAIPLYHSAACALQGFVWEERAVALQCHLESSPASIEALIAACPEDLEHPGAVQDAATIQAGSAHCASLKASLFRLLDYLSGPHAHLT
ncbi:MULTISPECIES: type 1 glutamine amidotransferase [unclassified Pseudomonas]|uniref:type 1 glutamine amidotransferase n=1 Tax=unclassified Pseudomonas TaxID=196821 RepID=UPI0024485C59|nr:MULTISPECIES: type 1 glutamine amidotransferase [unclassified Pseudomonas]MDG9926593.1 type 1 glutamine amidotransferase [Pseudomonas sp. GD04042]MDH0485946.1 type 1 glutamine amidotransferase [Pseudomonas sp. GD04015]MDH0603773.1 type 1 glutamine amidotransferase [Pseudomonas sp. GD03869]